MSKTPVSTLQEIAIKMMWGVPTYVLITDNSGTHMNRFTYKVICNSRSACGTATSKKQAKHIAAQELLKLLQENIGRATTPIVCHHIDSHSPPPHYNSLEDNTFINSVGKLNEYCAIKKFKTPDYQVLSMSGPSHARNFTIVCSIGNLKVEATANTKKQAKHDAALTMLDKLVRNTNYKKTHYVTTNDINDIDERIRNLDTLDLKIEKPSISLIESSARAKELFPKLKRYNGVTNKVMPNVSINHLHLAFKNTYDPFICETARSCLGQYTETTRQNVLDKVTSLLGLRVEIEILMNDPDHVIIMYTLNSTPVIRDTGIGSTYLDARDQAIRNILNSIDIFLR